MIGQKLGEIGKVVRSAMAEGPPSAASCMARVVKLEQKNQELEAEVASLRQDVHNAFELISALQNSAYFTK